MSFMMMRGRIHLGQLFPSDISQMEHCITKLRFPQTPFQINQKSSSCVLAQQIRSSWSRHSLARSFPRRFANHMICLKTGRRQDCKMQHQVQKTPLKVANLHHQVHRNQVQSPSSLSPTNLTVSVYYILELFSMHVAFS